MILLLHLWQLWNVARVIGLVDGSKAAGRDGLKLGARAPGFRLPSVSGAEIALSDFAGGRALLVFTQAEAEKLAKKHGMSKLSQMPPEVLGQLSNRAKSTIPE
jgi:hypothetical protein